MTRTLTLKDLLEAGSEGVEQSFRTWYEPSEVGMKACFLGTVLLGARKLGIGG